MLLSWVSNFSYTLHADASAHASTADAETEYPGLTLSRLNSADCHGSMALTGFNNTIQVRLLPAYSRLFLASSVDIAQGTVRFPLRCAPTTSMPQEAR